MASFVNNQNVFSYCAVKNDEILLYKSFNSDEKSESCTLKCSALASEDVSKKPNVSEIKEYRLITAVVSNCGKFVIACDANNLIHLWSYDGKSWNHKSQRRLTRKCQKIIFTNSGSDAIVADRSGDVFVYSVVDFLKEGRFLLGHISLIVDIAISSNDKYLLTCDRDGKIRLSHYPNSYNIYSYCLGHEEFVSSVQSILLTDELILSASGDGTVRLWSFSGDNICFANLFENEVLCKTVEKYQNVEDLKISLSCVLNEKQTIFAVKAVRFAPMYKVCAISFYMLKGVALYSILDSENIELKFIQYIPTDNIPFDILFNSLDDLIILQKGVKKQYSYFKYLEESAMYFEEKDSNTVFKGFKNVCENLDDIVEVQDNWEMLFKRNFDDSMDSKDNLSKKSKIG